MSAGLLRRAAARAREVAEAADATGSWSWRSGDGHTYWPQSTRSGRYIQTMHPAVALAVADWLDRVAVRAEEYAESVPPRVLESVVASECLGYVEALVVARLLLGEHS